MTRIHPTAIIAASAQLADDVSVGPYCVIEENVVIGAGTRLIAQCHVGSYTTIGTGNTFFPFSSVGTDPEDYAYTPDLGPSYTRIGNDNKFREGVTVNRGTKPGTETVIGNGCFLMANTHVSHNCVLGNKVILVPYSGAAGYCQIGDNCLISGLSGLHQFCRMGRMAVLSGGSQISMDLPPFMIGDGRNGGVRGFNIVGMRRNGFSPETIRAIKDVYNLFFRQDLNNKNAAARVRAEVPQLPEVVEFLEFVESSHRGILTGHRNGRRA